MADSSGSASSALTGELRRLPPSLGVRLLQALTLWLLVRNAVALFARLALGYRHAFALSAEGRELVLEQQKVLWGRPFKTARTVLPLDRLQEITLERAGESPAFSAGLVSLVAGTFLGFRFLTEGVLAPAGAPWLLGLGTLLIIGGVALDFFLGSGRTVKNYQGDPQLLVRVTGERGFVLSKLTRSAAETVLSRVQQSLATGEELSLSEPRETPQENQANPSTSPGTAS